MRYLFPFALLVASGVAGLNGQNVGLKTSISSSDVIPILEVLRADLVPGELAMKTPGEIASAWPDWVARRDAAIRARVTEGDEDSIVYFLLFGTTFTEQRRVTDRDLAALAVRPGDALKSLQQRLTDFVAATASPGTDERLQFVRRSFIRKGIDSATSDGKVQARRWLEEQAPRVAGAGLARSSTVLDPSAAAVDAQTVFRDRGLSSDTSIFIDHAVDRTLESVRGAGFVQPGTIRRIAVIGPGLDFTDKLEGYDFYPQQTIQPFAIVDSLRRHGLAPADLEIAAFDVSPRVLQHLETARERASAGRPYAIVLPRNIDRPWTPELVKYWQRAGDRIGEPGAAPSPPPNAGHVEVRRVLVSPPVVLALRPRDLNIVVERIDPVSPGQQFDLVVATNILLYYDVFQQALAAANIAKMLRPGGLLLTNNRVFELPPIPLHEVGHTDVTYMTLAGIGETGDRIVWYQRQ